MLIVRSPGRSGKALSDVEEVVGEQVLPDRLSCCPNDLGSRHFGRRPSGRDRRGNVGIRWRDDLGSVLGVDLVAVVGGRVVRRRDNDRSGPSEVERGVGHQRRRRRVREVADLEPSGHQHGDRVVHERRRRKPGIAPNNNRPLRSPRCRDEIVGKPLRCPDHRRAVHAIRPGLNTAAQTCSSELEGRSHPLGELFQVAGIDDALQFGSGHRVRVSGDPLCCCGHEICHGTNRTESAAAEHRRRRGVASELRDYWPACAGRPPLPCRRDPAYDARRDTRSTRPPTSSCLRNRPGSWIPPVRLRPRDVRPPRRFRGQ